MCSPGASTILIQIISKLKVIVIYLRHIPNIETEHDRAQGTALFSLKKRRVEMSRSNARRVLRMSEIPSNAEIKQLDHVITTLFPSFDNFLFVGITVTLFYDTFIATDSHQIKFLI